MLSSLLKWARINGYISWNDIEDRVRAYHDLTGWDSSEDFKSQSVKQFLTGYRRDLLQTQEKYIEIWIEKDALSTVFTKVAEPYTVSVVVCRGFSSVSFLKDYKDRLQYYMDKEPVLLYFGDFDPSGVEMLTAMQTTLREELNVDNITFKRVALQKEDIVNYQLPHSPDALKKTDTRAAKHIEQYGELAVELDALRPDVLEQKIKAAIEGELNMEAYYSEISNEKGELNKLNNIKYRVERLVEQIK